MVSVQSKVAEFADMVKLPYGGDIIEFIQWQIGSMLGMAVGPRPGSTQDKQREQASKMGSVAPSGVASDVKSGGVATSTIQGTIVPGGSLAQKLVWLQKSADSHNTYIIDVNANESITPHILEYSGAINITIILRGIGGNRTIRLSSNGTMFTVKQNVTFVLDNNITLRGHNQNTSSLVNVNGGLLKMNNGSTVIGNIGGTVHRWKTNNVPSDAPSGGGIIVMSGTFEMGGGTISSNTAYFGGGVVVGRGGIFTMYGGTISENRAQWRGGGVHIWGGTVTIHSGTISKNTAEGGGGVHIHEGTLIMRGGTISGNVATSFGGGVSSNYYFTKTGGTITGYKSDPINGNVVKDEDGNVLARKGHAIYLNDNKRKETTAGPEVNFAADGSGAWDQ